MPEQRRTQTSVVAASAVPRDDAFDLVKGVLVAAMVVYHAMNVVTTAGEEAFQYLRFVSGSFIFVTGLLISRYVAIGFDRDRVRASLKLIARGFKLVLLFTVLNLIIQASGLGSAAKQHVGIAGYLAQADTIYLRGDARVASFLILLPIGVLLICAPLLLRIVRPAKPSGSLLVLGLVLAIAALLRGGTGSLVANFVIVGVAGMCIGAWQRGPWLEGTRALRSVAIAAGLAASIWLCAKLYFNLALYTISVALVIEFLYAWARRVDACGRIASAFLLLGRCSLFAYIAQIAILQLLARALGRPQWPLGWEAAAFAASAGLALLVACSVLKWARHRSGRIDSAYRFVFA